MCASPPGKEKKAKRVIAVQSVIPEDHPEVLTIRRDDPQFCPKPAGIGIQALSPSLDKRGDEKRCIPLIHTIADLNVEFICCRIVKQPCQTAVLCNGCVTNRKNLHRYSISSRSFPRPHLSTDVEIRLPDHQTDMYGILLSDIRKVCGVSLGSV